MSALKTTGWNIDGPRASGARNTQYAQGLNALLLKLAVLRAEVTDVYVDSGALSALQISQRRLDVGSQGLPVDLQHADVAQIASLLKRSMAKVGRDSDARGSALLHGSKAVQISPLSTGGQVTIRADSGIPSAVIRFSTLTPIIASLVCASTFFALSLSPMMRLYRNIPFSPRAC